MFLVQNKSTAWCSLPLSLRLVSSSPQWFQTPEWDIHNSSILWRNLGACTDVAFVDNDGCSRQGIWHGRLNYITFKLFSECFSRLMSQWDEAHVVGIVPFLRQKVPQQQQTVSQLPLGIDLFNNWLLILLFQLMIEFRSEAVDSWYFVFNQSFSFVSFQRDPQKKKKT